MGLTPAELAKRLAGPLGVQAADFSSSDPHALRLVPERLARRFSVVPLRETDRELAVATADPNDLACEQALAFAAGRRVTFHVAAPGQVAAAIEKGYGGDSAADDVFGDLSELLSDAVRVIDAPSVDIARHNEPESGPIIRLTNQILRDAVRERASDIHMEPSESAAHIRFRVDGIMRQYMQLPLSALNRVISRIKVMSRLDIADRMRPQDGRVRIEVETQTVDLRVSTVPIRDAEKAVLRILRPDSAMLADIGILAPELARLRRLLACRDGIVLVTGPTGSGKTTTLYAALRELATGQVNIMTVEDPVEYELSGMSQMQVDARRGVTFASALRAILRQDPDVIFVGEIRDLETAEIAVQAAMTGHLVLASLHANDAVGAVGRLLDLGLDRAAVAATVRGALAQRLVRRVCPECAQPVGQSLTDEELRLSALLGAKPAVRATGCSHCANSGFRGRLPVQEIAVFTPQMLDLIARGSEGTQQALQRLAVAEGMRPLRTTALERARSGETTLAECERVIGADSAPAAAPSSLPASVLVVDDDPMQRLLVTSLLSKNGFRASQADDGATALELIRNGESYSLVLTDFHMGAMNGDELVRRLRANPQSAAIPIIVLTGSADADKETELIDLGADDYIRKPLEPALLLARVRATLRRATAHN